MKQYVLGIDIGSGSVKLTLLSREGEISGSAGCEYPTFYPQPGWCEQNPEDWCTAFKTAFADLLKKTGISKEDICAVAPDAATHTAVLLDENFSPIRPAILWTDQRSKKQVNALTENHSKLIREQCLNTPTTVWTLPQMMWIRENEPENWCKIRHILFAKDYLRYRLTGVIATDTIDAAGSMFFDVENTCWSEQICKLSGIDMNWLPRLCDPIDLSGKVTESASREFGLKENTCVFTGTTDTVMEVFASGSVTSGHATVKLATAGRICVISPKKLDSDFIFNYRHIVPGLWYPGTGTASCANSYRWYRDTLGRSDYAKMDKEASMVAPGCDGLLFHPYLNGELTPYNDPNLRASYVGISAMHTNAHFTRATLEGVAFSLRDCLETLYSLGVDLNRVRIIGGGAKGILWRQIVSDILNLDLEKVEVDDSSFGSAMLAAVGMGWFDDYEQAAETCVKIETVSKPNPENRALYDHLFLRYKKIHDALEEFYK